MIIIGIQLVVQKLHNKQNTHIYKYVYKFQLSSKEVFHALYAERYIFGLT